MTGRAGTKSLVVKRRLNSPRSPGATELPPSHACAITSRLEGHAGVRDRVRVAVSGHDGVAALVEPRPVLRLPTGAEDAVRRAARMSVTLQPSPKSLERQRSTACE